MSLTLAEIDRSTECVRAKLRQDEPVPSLEEYLEMWRAEREWDETIETVRHGIENMETGRFDTLEEVDRRIRKNLGFAPTES